MWRKGHQYNYGRIGFFLNGKPLDEITIHLYYYSYQSKFQDKLTLTIRRSLKKSTLE